MCNTLRRCKKAKQALHTGFLMKDQSRSSKLRLERHDLDRYGTNGHDIGRARRLSRGCGKKSAKDMEETDCDASVTGSSKIYDKV